MASAQPKYSEGTRVALDSPHGCMHKFDWLELPNGSTGQSVGIATAGGDLVQFDAIPGVLISVPPAWLRSVPWEH